MLSQELKTLIAKYYDVVVTMTDTEPDSEEYEALEDEVDSLYDQIEEMGYDMSKL